MSLRIPSPPNHQEAGNEALDHWIFGALRNSIHRLYRLYSSMIFLSQGTSSTTSIGKHLGVHGAKFWDRSVRFQRAPHMLEPLQPLQRLSTVSTVSTVSTGQWPGKPRLGIGVAYGSSRSSIVKDPLVDCSSFLCKICFQVGSVQD